MQPDSYPATPRTTPARLPERARYDRATVHAVLDEALVCHLGYLRDGRPMVLPTIHVRIGEVLYVHGSTGASSALAAARGPVPVCVTVTILDGLVLARSAFHHSMNYRSVVVHGTARAVTDDEERQRVLAAIVDRVAPGRWDQCRPPNPKELAATSILAVPLEEVSAKCRSGDPVDEDTDLDGPWWAGVIPVRTGLDVPEPAADLLPGRTPPALAS